MKLKTVFLLTLKLFIYIFYYNITIYFDKNQKMFLLYNYNIVKLMKIIFMVIFLF